MSKKKPEAKLSDAIGAIGDTYTRGRARGDAFDALRDASKDLSRGYLEEEHPDLFDTGLNLFANNEPTEVWHGASILKIFFENATPQWIAENRKKFLGTIVEAATAETGSKAYQAMDILEILLDKSQDPAAKIVGDEIAGHSLINAKAKDIYTLKEPSVKKRGSSEIHSHGGNDGSRLLYMLTKHGYAEQVFRYPGVLDQAIAYIKDPLSREQVLGFELLIGLAENGMGKQIVDKYPEALAVAQQKAEAKDTQMHIEPLASKLRDILAKEAPKRDSVQVGQHVAPEPANDRDADLPKRA